MRRGLALRMDFRIQLMVWINKNPQPYLNGRGWWGIVQNRFLKISSELEPYDLSQELK